MNIAANQSISTRELLVFIYRYRRRLILSFAIPLLLAFIASFLPSPKYVATSDMVVRLGSEFVYQPESGGSSSSPNQPLPFAVEEMFKAEVAILSSDDLHEQVLHEMGLQTVYPELYKKGLLSPITDGINKVMLMLGLAEQHSADDVDRYMYALGTQIFDKHFDILLEKESAVIDVSFENKDRDVALKTLEVLLKDYMEKREKLYLEPRVAMAKEQAESTHAKAIATEQALDDFKRKHNIHSFAEERTSLLTQRGAIEQQGSEIISDGVTNKMSYYDHRLDQLDDLEQQMDVLTNDAKIAADEYGLYQHKLDEAVAYEDMEHQRLSSVRIIQPPLAPADPKKIGPLILLAGTVLSFLSMLGTAVITEYMNNSFMTPERLERNLGLRVLAVLPYFE